ncbi:MAG: outer membrane beta-barrel protein [Vicinamibacterales bacterium]
MKRMIAAVAAGCVLVLCVPTSAKAQPTASLFAGAAFTTIPAFEDFGAASHSTAGFLLGVATVFPVAPTAGIQVETAYTRKSAEQAASGGGVTVTANQDLDYLESAVLARIGPRIRSRPQSGYFLTGLGFSLLLRARGKITISGGGTSDSAEEDIKDDTTSGDVNFIIGGGAMIGRLGIEARYDWGFLDIDKNPAAGDPALKTRTFSVIASVHFQR